ncbi:GntR family transcriptional regulator [Streptomyces sp. NPDC003860]
MYRAEQPKYVRLAETLRTSIANGTYAPGEKIPSEPQLAAEHGMSRPTVVRALELLKRDGWLESRQGYGTVVRPRAAHEAVLTRLDAAVEAVVAAAAGMPPADRARVLSAARASMARLDHTEEK